MLPLPSFDSGRHSARPWFGRSLWLGVFLVALLLPGRVQAGTVLVAGFLEEGKPNARVRQGVMRFLQRMGEQVVGGSISGQDLLCTQTECLVRLAEHHQAQRIIGGDLTTNDNSYRIMVWIYDRITEQPNSVEAVCTDCNPEQLADTVARTAGQLLEAGTAPVPPPRPAAPRVEIAPQPRCATPYRSFGRGIALGSFSALTLAGLITAFALIGYDGQVYRGAEGNSPELTYNFRSHYRLAFSMSAVSALGIVAAAAPWQDIIQSQAADGVAPPTVHCPTTGRTHNRYNFGRGMAIGALSSFSVAGLVSAITLTSLHGSVYANNPDGTTATYNLKPQYSAAYGISAGMIAGLGLAIFIP